STGDRGRGPGRRRRIPDRWGGAEEETPRVRDPTSPGTVPRQSNPEEPDPACASRAAEPFPPRVAGWMEGPVHGCQPSPVWLSAPNRLDRRPQTLPKAVRLGLMSFASPVRRTISWSDRMASLEPEGYRHRAPRDEGHGLLEPLAAGRDRLEAGGCRGAGRDPHRKARALGRPRRNGQLRHLGIVDQDPDGLL